MKEGLITGNLVQEYRLGNTKIKIYDSAYVGKTKQDIESILIRIAEIGNSTEGSLGRDLQAGL